MSSLFSLYTLLAFVLLSCHALLSAPLLLGEFLPVECFPRGLSHTFSFQGLFRRRCGSFGAEPYCADLHVHCQFIPFWTRHSLPLKVCMFHFHWFWLILFTDFFLVWGLGFPKPSLFDQIFRRFLPFDTFICHYFDFKKQSRLLLGWYWIWFESNQLALFCVVEKHGFTVLLLFRDALSSQDAHRSTNDASTCMEKPLYLSYFLSSFSVNFLFCCFIFRDCLPPVSLQSRCVFPLSRTHFKHLSYQTGSVVWPSEIPSADLLAPSRRTHQLTSQQRARVFFKVYFKSLMPCSMVLMVKVSSSPRSWSRPEMCGRAEGPAGLWLHRLRWEG